MNDGGPSDRVFLDVVLDIHGWVSRPGTSACYFAPSLDIRVLGINHRASTSGPALCVVGRRQSP